MDFTSILSLRFVTFILLLNCYERVSNKIFFQEFETLKLEISEIEKGIESTKQDVEKCEASIVQFKEEETQLQEQVTQAKVCALILVNQ